MTELILCTLSMAVAIRLTGGQLRPKRLLLSGAVGTVLSGFIRRTIAIQGLRVLLGVPLAALCMGLADREGTVRHPGRSVLSVLAASGLLGGMMTAAANAVGNHGAGLAIGLAAAAPVCAFLISSRGGTPSGPVVLRIAVNGRTVRIPAIIDSGNTLRDYLTHRPVIVLAQEPWRTRLGFPAAGNLPTGLRLIFADTAGGRQQMGCFIPDAAVLETESGRRIIRAAAAFSAGLAEEAPALVPGCVAKE